MFEDCSKYLNGVYISFLFIVLIYLVAHKIIDIGTGWGAVAIVIMTIGMMYFSLPYVRCIDKNKKKIK